MELNSKYYLYFFLSLNQLINFMMVNNILLYHLIQIKRLFILLIYYLYNTMLYIHFLTCNLKMHSLNYLLNAFFHCHLKMGLLYTFYNSIIHIKSLLNDNPLGLHHIILYNHLILLCKICLKMPYQKIMHEINLLLLYYHIFLP